MPFVEQAKYFLEDPGELSDSKYIDEMNITVNFLLNNAVGLENAKSTDKIIHYLNEEGYAINRHQWEINVLGKLRDEGVYIGSHKSKGMYLIKSKLEAENYYLQMSNRISKEVERRDFLRMLIDNSSWESF